MPGIKLSGNPFTCSATGEHINLGVSRILSGDMTFDWAGEHLLELMVRTANGRLTASEALGQREFVITKLYRSV